MRNVSKTIQGMIVAGCFSFSSLAMAQSCGETAYQDVSDCQKYFQAVKAYANSSAATVGSISVGRGMAVPAQQTGAIGNSAAAWAKLKNFCSQKLNDCQTNCTGENDANYLQACQNQISPIIADADQAAVSNRSVASTADAISNSSGDEAHVQQVGLMGQAVAACKIGYYVANCLLNPMQQPTLTDTVQRPAIIQISPNQMIRSN